MARSLIIYTNCSKGGVTSVIRNRALSQPTTEFAAVFLNDRNGARAFDDIPNISVRIVRRDRATTYLKYILANFGFTSISILSEPDIANSIAPSVSVPVEYEFHSSDSSVIERELAVLNTSQIDRIVVPSAYLRQKVSALMPQADRTVVEVRPNLVDVNAFSAAVSQDDAGFGSLPSFKLVLWVGRFDKGKGYKQFLRVLGALPDGYYGIAVVSLESDPMRAAEFFYECDSAGAADRVSLFADISNAEMAQLLRAVRDSGGFLLSTSLMESFGYSVAEALAVGTRVIAYELPALQELPDNDKLLTFVPIGSFADVVREATRELR